MVIEAMESSRIGPLTLGPMGEKGGGNALYLVMSLILDLSAYRR